MLHYIEDHYDSHLLLAAGEPGPCTEWTPPTAPSQIRMAVSVELLDFYVLNEENIPSIRQVL